MPVHFTLKYIYNDSEQYIMCFKILHKALKRPFYFRIQRLGKMILVPNPSSCQWILFTSCNITATLAWLLALSQP
jgi:hypothetical protein